MFEFAFIIGVYSYLIFFLGITGLLYKNLILAVTLVYIFAVFFYFLKYGKIYKNFRSKLNYLSKIILSLIFIQAVVNFVGVLGPEISFDALWYHLTLPKIYLLNQFIFHIPGNLLYYSDMPKLVEMIYISALSFGGEVLAKFVHFSAGLLSVIVIYKISRKFVPQAFALLACLIFYSNLVVGWESITAYIDLARTFFEVLAFLGFLNFVEKKEKKWLVISGIMLGFAITSKLASMVSLPVFFILFISYGVYNKNKLISSLKNFAVFFFCAIIIPIPWFLFAFLNTGNPLYPYFSNIPVDSGKFISLPNIAFIFRDLYNLFLSLNDPISPVYLIFLPLIIVLYKNFNVKTKLLVVYTLISFLLWYLFEQVRGGRFILPYLPVFSVLVSYSIYRIKDRKLKYISVLIILIVALSSVGYRSIANKKFLPVIFGMETKREFLSRNLNFSYGDFYDTDNYFKNNLKKTDVVLLYGFHNLYYIDFNFIDSSFIKKGDYFNYVAVQDSTLPARFSRLRQIYYNKLTNVRLYTMRGKKWVF